MKRLIRLLPLAALCVAILVAVPALASAKSKSTTCNGTLASGSYQKVVVPDGAVCFVETPVTIRGGLFIGSGATFVLGDEEQPGDNGTITGGVHATDAMNVQIHFMTINGGVDIKGGSGPFGGPFDVTFNTIEDSWINGGVGRVHPQPCERLCEPERQRARGPGRERVRDQHHPREPQLQRQLSGTSGRRLGGQPQSGHGLQDRPVRRALRRSKCI
jgi:hypothetical protein